MKVKIFEIDFKFFKYWFQKLEQLQLFKIDNNNLNKEIVTIKYTNINKINSLEEWCHFKYILLKNTYNKVKDLTYIKKYVIM